MAFKYIDGKIVEVEHKTVYGLLLQGIGGLSTLTVEKPKESKKK